MALSLYIGGVTEWFIVSVSKTDVGASPTDHGFKSRPLRNYLYTSKVAQVKVKEIKMVNTKMECILYYLQGGVL